MIYLKIICYTLRITAYQRKFINTSVYLCYWTNGLPAVDGHTDGSLENITIWCTSSLMSDFLYKIHYKKNILRHSSVPWFCHFELQYYVNDRSFPVRKKSGVGFFCERIKIKISLLSCHKIGINDVYFDSSRRLSLTSDRYTNTLRQIKYHINETKKTRSIRSNFDLTTKISDSESIESNEKHG